MRGFPLTKRKRKKRPLLEDESTCWGRYFYVSCWRWDSHFPWSSELHEGLAFCRIKAVPSCVAFKPLCKKEHPRIVTFSSLHNAYFDKLCHSFIHSFIFALFFKFLKAPFNFLPIEELYVCKSRMQARPHAYLWNLVICPSEKFWWLRDHLSAGPSAPQGNQCEMPNFLN